MMVEGLALSGYSYLSKYLAANTHFLEWLMLSLPPFFYYQYFLFVFATIGIFSLISNIIT